MKIKQYALTILSGATLLFSGTQAFGLSQREDAEQRRAVSLQRARENAAASAQRQAERNAYQAERDRIALENQRRQEAARAASRSSSSSSSSTNKLREQEQKARIKIQQQNQKRNDERQQLNNQSLAERNSMTKYNNNIKKVTGVVNPLLKTAGQLGLWQKQARAEKSQAEEKQYRRDRQMLRDAKNDEVRDRKEDRADAVTEARINKSSSTSSSRSMPAAPVDNNAQEMTLQRQSDGTMKMVPVQR